jgi:hypothetical protein
MKNDSKDNIKATGTSLKIEDSQLKVSDAK